MSRVTLAFEGSLERRLSTSPAGSGHVPENRGPHDPIRATELTSVASNGKHCPRCLLEDADDAPDEVLSKSGREEGKKDIKTHVPLGSLYGWPEASLGIAY